MPKFKVTVCRISYAFNDVIIEADTIKEAKEIALDESGHHEYSEKHANYETQDWIEVKD